MINTITHLIETQTQDFVYPDYQRFPYWFSRALNFDPLEIWLANTWAWSHDNARDSHQNAHGKAVGWWSIATQTF